MVALEVLLDVLRDVPIQSRKTSRVAVKALQVSAVGLV